MVSEKVIKEMFKVTGKKEQETPGKEGAVRGKGGRGLSVVASFTN